MTVDDVCRSMGLFFYNEQGKDIDNTYLLLLKLLISKVEVDNDIVTIYTSRPGLLIGPKGKRINALGQHLKKTIKVVEVNCVTDMMYWAVNEEHAWTKHNEDC
jgi:hypothetical protein